MSGPSQDRSAVKWIVIHYNGGNADLDGPDNIFQDEDYARVIARMNDQYWESASRGYALGYNFGCGPDGDLWEIRGTDIRCGANGCQLNNVPGVAIQVTTTAVTAPPTNAQIHALKNRWVPWLRTQYPRALTIVGHRDIRGMCSDDGGTACPGPQLYPLVQQGYFNTPDQSQEEDVPITAAEMDQIAAKAAAAVWNALIDNVTDPTKPDVAAKTALAYVLRNSAATYTGEAPASTVAKQDLDQLEVAVAEVKEIVENISIGGVDVAAIAKAVNDETANRLAE